MAYLMDHVGNAVRDLTADQRVLFTGVENIGQGHQPPQQMAPAPATQMNHGPAQTMAPGAAQTMSHGTYPGFVYMHPPMGQVFVQGPGHQQAQNQFPHQQPPGQQQQGPEQMRQMPPKHKQGQGQHKTGQGKAPRNGNEKGRVGRLDKGKGNGKTTFGTALGKGKGKGKNKGGFGLATFHRCELGLVGPQGRCHITLPKSLRDLKPEEMTIFAVVPRRAPVPVDLEVAAAPENVDLGEDRPLPRKRLSLCSSSDSSSDEAVEATPPRPSTSASIASPAAPPKDADPEKAKEEGEDSKKDGKKEGSGAKDELENEGKKEVSQGDDKENVLPQTAEEQIASLEPAPDPQSATASAASPKAGKTPKTSKDKDQERKRRKLGSAKKEKRIDKKDI